MKNFNKFLSFILCLGIIFSFAAVSVFADDIEDVDGLSIDTSDIVPGKLSIKFKNVYNGDIISLFPDIEVVGYEDIYLSAILASGKSIEDVSQPLRESVGKSYTLILEDNTVDAVIDAVEKLKNNPLLEYVEPDRYISIENTYPNDALYNPESYTPQWGLSKIKAPKAWDYVTDSDVKVAVIDTGIDHEHPDLDDNVDLTLAYNAYTRQAGNTMDYCGHGTHVAGIIGAEGNNEIGVAGVCWDVSLVPIKISTGTEAESTVAIMAHAITYVNSMNIPIANLSFSIDYDSVFLDAVSAYTASGGLFVKSAGNDGESNDNKPEYVAFQQMPGVIVVGSAHYGGSPDYPAESSNYGINTVNLFAPGEDVRSTWLNDGYELKSGTSMATPFVAGAAALLKGANPNLTNVQLKAALLSGVDYSVNLEGYCATSGRLNVYNSLLSIGKNVSVDSSVVNGVITPSAIFAPSPSVVILSVDPDDGYMLKPNTLRYNGTLTNALPDGRYNFAMPTVDVVITAQFYMIADVDFDGSITMSDVLGVMRHVSGAAPLTGDALLAADVNGDGVVNNTDTQTISDYVAHNIDRFPIEG